MAERNPKQLLEHAVQLEKHAEALATGLAKQGVDEAVVQTVEKCAEIGRELVKVLAQSPATSEPAPQETVGSATDAMMAERQQAPAPAAA